MGADLILSQARSDAESIAKLRAYADDAEALSRDMESCGEWAEAEWWLHEATVARDEYALLEEFVA